MTLNDIKAKIVYFTNSIQGINIPIYPIKVSNTRANKITKRTPGKSAQTANEDKPADTKINNRLRIENVYEVDGYIEAIESSDTDVIFFPDAKTAYEVKRDLIQYIFNENSKENIVYMNYEGEIIYGNIEKLDITEEAMDKDTTTAEKYAIKLIFVAKDNRIT